MVNAQPHIRWCGGIAVSLFSEKTAEFGAEQQGRKGAIRATPCQTKASVRRFYATEKGFVVQGNLLKSKPCNRSIGDENIASIVPAAIAGECSALGTSAKLVLHQEVRGR